MAAAGIDVVRMGEFAREYVESLRGEFDLAWFDHAIELLGRGGVPHAPFPSAFGWPNATA